MARQRKPAKLGLDPASYNPVGLRAYSMDELKHEYASLRREATERVRSLGRSKQWSQTQAYRSNVGQYPTLAQIGNDRRALERKIIRAQRFVSAKASSPSGLRDIQRKQLESLHRNAGYDWVNSSNAQSFYEFLNWLDARGEKNLFYELLRASDEEDPEEIEHAGDEMEEAFNRWLEGQGEVDPFDAMYQDEDEDEDEPEPQPQPKPKPQPKPAGKSYPAKKQPGRRGKQKQKQKRKKRKKRGH